MHPIIAFLSFIFSPTDDWALRNGYQLLMDPQEIVATAEDYRDMAQTYPSTEADPAPLMTWAEILSRAADPMAQKWWDTLSKAPFLSPALATEIELRFAETAFKNGATEKAREKFVKLAAHDNHRRVDALANILLCDLVNGDAAAAKESADELTAALSNPAELPRAVFPLGLAAFINKDFETALTYFAQEPDEARARYFEGLALRAMEKPKEALTSWQKIKQTTIKAPWVELADFQITETYFALGDHTLSRKAGETALATHSDGITRDSLVFRLASIDIAEKRYDDALARLSTVTDNETLADRTTVLMAESLVKTGRNKDILAMLEENGRREKSAMSHYQLAWAALLNDKNERAFDEAEKGLENFYDPNVTPRLLLLQGIALEKEENEAAALATYQTIIDRFTDSASAAQATHWMTLAYLRLGRHQEALTHANFHWKNLSYENRRSHPETAFWLGEAAARLERPTEADRYYDAFLTVAAPDHELTPYAQFERSAVLAKMGKNEEAIALLGEFAKSARELNHSSWVTLAHLQQGHMLYNQRHYEKAIAAYRESGDSAKSLYQQGLALYRMDYFTDAAETWNKLAALHPNDALAEDGLFRIGRTYFELGQATAAVTAFARYINTYPAHPRVKEAMLQSAHAMYNAGDMSAAAPLYTAYLSHYKETKDLATVAPYLAACYAESNKPLEEIETALKGLPPTETLAALQWTQGAKDYNDKNFADAVHNFGSSLVSLPRGDNARNALFYRAESLYQGEKWFDAEKGLNHYLAATSEEPDANTSTALFHQAVSVYRQDRLLEAAELFDRFAAQHPDHALSSDAKENMALCYHGLGMRLMPEKPAEATPTNRTIVEVDRTKSIGWKELPTQDAAILDATNQ